MSFEKFSVLAIKVAPLCLALLVQVSCAKCTRSLEEAPELRGFHLSTTVTQLQNRFPGFPNLTANEFGSAKVIISVASMPGPETVKPSGDGNVLLSASRYPELLGTDRIILEFVDGRLATITVFYPKDLKWHSVDEFVQQTSEALDLPDGWETSDSTKDYKRVFCKGFYVRAGIDHEKYDEEKLPFVEVGDTMSSIQPMLRTLNRNENENRKEEERRKTFKP